MLKYKHGKERNWTTWKIGDPIPDVNNEGPVTIQCVEPQLLQFLLQGIITTANSPVEQRKAVENLYPGRFTYLVYERIISFRDQETKQTIHSGPKTERHTLSVIKAIREITPCGLAEAKKMWDDMNVPVFTSSSLSLV